MSQFWLIKIINKIGTRKSFRCIAEQQFEPIAATNQGKPFFLEFYFSKFCLTSAVSFVLNSLSIIDPTTKYVLKIMMKLTNNLYVFVFVFVSIQKKLPFERKDNHISNDIIKQPRKMLWKQNDTFSSSKEKKKTCAPWVPTNSTRTMFIIH